jgi:dsRNA-gated channel SID-1
MEVGERTSLLSQGDTGGRPLSGSQGQRRANGDELGGSGGSAQDESVEVSAVPFHSADSLGKSYTVEDMLRSPPTKQKTDEVYLKFYWKILFLVAVFYGVPSFQFVMLVYFEYSDHTAQDAQNITALHQDSTDTLYCYFNFKCAHQFAGFDAFNNILSNILYLLCGLGFNLFVYLRERKLTAEGLRSVGAASIQASREGSVMPVAVGDPDPSEDTVQDADTKFGLHSDCSLYYCLGWALVFEGIYSALYHVCPSRIAFQFDMTFMILTGSFLMLTLYQKRQPMITSGPYRVYGYFGLGLVAITVSLFPVPANIFWPLVWFPFVWASLWTSIHIYYNRKPRLNSSSGARLAQFAQKRCLTLPRHKMRFGMVFAANALNFAFVGLATVQGLAEAQTQSFPLVVLGILQFDALIYLIYYWIQKYRQGEHVRLLVWLLAVFLLASGAIAIFFFEIPVTNKLLSPAQSLALNKPCALFGYFDYHDIWHFLSAFAVSSFFLLVYLLDSDLDRVPRRHIKVF